MIVGTAGHVDHGKTTLVKAITGVDTDRFAEEKRRGLTIDLGFAYAPLPGGRIVGFVDVPGHERFIHNMLSGITGIDYVLLVVAADDGPMPQTREHLAIVDLLGVTRGAIAITKIDAVDRARVEEVRAALRALVAGTGLAGAPFIPLSAHSGENLDTLVSLLYDAARAAPARPDGGRFRLAVDRSFTLKGAGTVVTGTVFAGRVRTGERVLLSPSGREARVKALHAHNQASDTGLAGQRCALNLAGPGIGKSAIHRGDWVIDPALHAPADRVDAVLTVLPGEARALRHWTPVHLHVGAADSSARVAVLEGDTLAPGAQGLVQLVLAEPAAVLHGDRFIIRDQSATRTLGGGWILDPFPPARGRRRPERLAVLRAQQTADPAAALPALLEASPAGLDLSVFARAWNLTGEECRRLCQQARLKTVSGGDATYAFFAPQWERCREAATRALTHLHAGKPDQPGFGEAELRRSSGLRLRREVFSALIKELVEGGAVARDGARLKLPAHRAAGLSGSELELWNAVRQRLEAGGLKPPRLRALSEQVGADPGRVQALLERLTREGAVYEVNADLYFLASLLHGLAEQTEALCRARKDGCLSIGDFRKATGLSRNVSIELLEFFDRRGLTVRVEAGRRLQKSASVVFNR